MDCIEKRTVSDVILDYVFDLMDHDDVLIDTMSFFSLDANGHFLVRQLRLLPRVPLPAPSEVQSPGSSSHNLASLPLPNPFKAMIHRSSDNVSIIPNFAGAGRIVLGDETDAGELLPQGTFVASRTRSSEGRLRGIVWTDQEITVSAAVSNCLVILSCHITGFCMEQPVSCAIIHLAEGGISRPELGR